MLTGEVRNESKRPERSLKSRVFRASSWSVFAHFFALALRFIGSLILTRIFTPDIFGVLAVIFAVQVIIALLTDIGLRQVVIQSPNGETPSFLNTAWTLQIFRGLIIWGSSIVVSGAVFFGNEWSLIPAGSVYALKDFPAYIMTTSFSAVILGFQSIKVITANRDLNLKRITFLDMTAQTASLIFVVLVGWMTHSIWAYIVGGLVTSVVSVILSHVFLLGPRDRFAWNREALAEFAKLGKWNFISSAVGGFSMNGDSLLLGGWFDAAFLGYYSIAKNLASVVDGVVGSIYGSISLPALSEIARVQPHRFPEILFRMRWITDPLLLGSAGFLFAAGPSIVSILYDARYASAGWMLQWLSFGLVFSRYGLVHSAYYALGLPQYITAITVTRLASIFTIVPLLYYLFDARGAVVGIAFHMLPATLLVFYLNRRHGLNNFRLEVTALAPWLAGWILGWGSVELIALIKQGFSQTFS